MVETIKAFVPNPSDVFCLPDRNALPYERLIGDTVTTQQRMQALIAMVERERTPLVVCSARTLDATCYSATGVVRVPLSPANRARSRSKPDAGTSL